MLLCLISTARRALAQAPDSISFQGFVTNPGGTPLNGTEVMKFKLYKNGTAVWTETHPSVTVTDGIFDVLLGSVTPLRTVAFDQPVELGITLGTEPEDPEVVPRTPLAAAPFALGMRGVYAVWADNTIMKGFNIIGGAANNSVDEGVAGATISGGGGIVSENIPYPNHVASSFGTIGGGGNNTIASGGAFATIGGGSGSTTSNSNATVAGGATNEAAGAYSTVGGGLGNEALDSWATVAGGRINKASGSRSTVPGGEFNSATGYTSFAAGYQANALHDGAFVWADRSLTGSFDSLKSTGPNQFLIRAAGGVGIGTNSPKPGVTVSRQSQAAAYQLELRNVGNITGGNFDGIAFTQHETGATELASIKVLYQNDGRPDMSFSVRDASNAIFIENETGDVGIGTTSPSQELHVNGDITAVSVTETSDARFKRNILPVIDATSRVRALQGVTFDWNQEDWPDRVFETGSQIGLIAQDVEVVVPEVVDVGDDGFYSVAYAKLVPLLIEAIKEQQAIIESQQDRLAALEARTATHQ